MGDQMLDLIHANQEAVAAIKAEGQKRIAKAMREGNMDLANRIHQAVNTFHPLHAEDWDWPAGSEL